MILVTGGAGFIGSTFILEWLAQSDEPVINLDKLTYAGNVENLASLRGDRRHHFVHGDINDGEYVSLLLETQRPRAIIHFAAESHVDRSIDGPGEFVRANVCGTQSMLEAARRYWEKMPRAKRPDFRFLHVSTDEVYGSLGPDDKPFAETDQYAPSTPYAASKAAADHFVRAYHLTYGLPTLTTNCSNNYGPRQYPEKLIPLMIARALAGEPLLMHGDGQQVRDWLHVSDHCAALRLVLSDGLPGETYNIGGMNERTNIEIVRLLCQTLDEMVPTAGSYADRIMFVKDRAGNDRRYAIDIKKIMRSLGWVPTVPFEHGLRQTVAWYLGQRIKQNELEAA